MWTDPTSLSNTGIINASCEASHASVASRCELTELINTNAQKRLLNVHASSLLKVVICRDIVKRNVESGYVDVETDVENKLPIDVLDHHEINTCGKRTLECSHNSCNVQVWAHDLELHEASCEFRPIECPLKCGEILHGRLSFSPYMSERTHCMLLW